MKKKPTAAPGNTPIDRDPNTLEMFELPLAQTPEPAAPVKAEPLTPAERAKRYRATVSELKAENSRLRQLNELFIQDLKALLASMTSAQRNI